ncbi:hypothetical protein AB0E01_43655 [Nocardia vinacea]|uniref:hypothetical protein n=1 Tax=Nocardia vinacea TaxID=96468 RepID=UPI0033F2185D
MTTPTISPRRNGRKPLGSTDWRVDRNSQPKIATNRAQKTMSNGDGRAGNWVSWQGGGGTQGGKFAADNYA